MLVRPEPPLPGPQPQSGTTSPTGTDAPSPCGRSARDRAAVRGSPVAPRSRRGPARQGRSASMAEVPGEQVAGGAVQVAAAAVVAAGGAWGRGGPWRPAGPAGWRRRPGSAWRRCAHRVRRQPRGQGGRENGGAAEARVASRVPRLEQGRDERPHHGVLPSFPGALRECGRCQRSLQGHPRGWCHGHRGWQRTET